MIFIMKGLVVRILEKIIGENILTSLSGIKSLQLFLIKQTLILVSGGGSLMVK